MFNHVLLLKINVIDIAHAFTTVVAIVFTTVVAALVGLQVLRVIIVIHVSHVTPCTIYVGILGVAALSAADHYSPGAAEVEWGGRRQPITLCPNRRNRSQKKIGG